MSVEKNYYEVMGLPRNATAEQIKKRYRELARKYHPDVVKDKEFGERMFVQITEAYQTLIDPNKRAAYNLTLPYVSSEPGSRKSAKSGTSGTTSQKSGAPGPSRGVDTLIRDARFSFIKGRFNEAANLCRMVLDIDRRNSKAHSILGDIYTAQRKVNKAIDEYTYAIQLDPNDQDSREKLDRLVTQRKPKRPKKESVTADVGERISPMFAQKQMVMVNAIGWPVAVWLVLLLGVLPGEPIGSLRHYLPLIDQWSWNVIFALGLSSALASALLMINGLLEHPDDELIMDEAGFLPLGLPLLLFSALFFWGAAAFYLLFSAIQNHISRSVVKVFAIVSAIVLLTGLMYPIGSDQVWLFGGNVAFIGALAGWYGAAMMRPLSG